MAKPVKSDRQAKIDQIRKKQRGSDKRRGYLIVGVCVALALLIVGAAAYKPIKDWWDLRQYEEVALAEIGAPASSCKKVETKDADGNQDHVQPGTPIVYTDSPPAFGQHYDTPDTMERKLYTSDRPELGTLVHNLEHGYTILWYDDTVAEDEAMMDDIRAIATKFEGTSDFRKKFKAVPWTAEDGKPFPDDQHIAYTHWSKGGGDQELETGTQVGVWQYCSAPSGAALDDFMIEYPYLDSPEPDAM